MNLIALGVSLMLLAAQTDRTWSLDFDQLSEGSLPDGWKAEATGQEQGRDQQAELTQQLRSLIERLRQKRTSYYEQKARQEASIIQACQNRQALEGQVDALRVQEAELDQQIERCRSEIQTLRTELEQEALLQETIAEEMRRWEARQKPQIDEGIPYRQQERVARLPDAAVDADASGRGNDRLAQLWSFAREELHLAHSSETYVERATAGDGTTPYARFIRVGQFLLGYVTEDGRQTAVWIRSENGGRWESISDSMEAAQVRRAIAILDRREAPRFVLLPVVSDMNSESEGP